MSGCLVPSCPRPAFAWGVCAEHHADELCVAWAWDAPVGAEVPPRRAERPRSAPRVPLGPDPYAYGRKALEGIVARFDDECGGGRNNALAAAAWACGRLVGGGLLPEAEARDALVAAGTSVGLSRGEALAVVGRRPGEGQLGKGARQPRQIPQATAQGERWRPVRLGRSLTRRLAS